MDKELINKRITKIEELLENDEKLNQYVESVDKKIEIDPNASKNLKNKIQKRINQKRKYSPFDLIKLACVMLIMVGTWEVTNNFFDKGHMMELEKSVAKIQVKSEFVSQFEKFSNSMMNYERKGEK